MKILMALIILCFSFSTQAIDLTTYNCKYESPLKRVNGDEWGIKIKGPKGDGSVCVAKLVCEWNIDSFLPPAGWTENAPPKFEAQSACTVDKDGSCGKSFKACSDDENVEFDPSESKNTFRDQKLGVRPIRNFLNGTSK